MKRYIVLCLSVGALSNKVLQSGDECTAANFPEGHAEKLVADGSLREFTAEEYSAKESAEDKGRLANLAAEQEAEKARLAKEAEAEKLRKEQEAEAEKIRKEQEAAAKKAEEDAKLLKQMEDEDRLAKAAKAAATDTKGSAAK